MAAGKQDLEAAQQATATVLASIGVIVDAQTAPAPAPPPAPEVDLTAEVTAENELTNKAREILNKLQSPTPPPPPAAA